MPKTFLIMGREKALKAFGVVAIRNGYQVIFPGASGIEDVNPDSVDLVIVDVPDGMDMRWVYCWVRGHFGPEKPIIFAARQPRLVSDVMQDNSAGVIMEPMYPGHLVKLIKAMLNAKTNPVAVQPGKMKRDN